MSGGFSKLAALPTPAKLVVGGILLAIIIASIFAFFGYLSKENAREEGNLKNQGATEERNKGNEEALNVVHNAVRPVSADERRAECLRNNRNPAAC